MNIKEMIKNNLNKLSKGVTNQVNKVAQNIPIEYIYLAYKVRKSTTLEQTNIGNNVMFDLFEYTYVDVQDDIVIELEDKTYKNPKTQEKYNLLNYASLMSKHLAHGANIDIKKYPNFNKREILGIYCLTKFEDVVNKVIDDELKSTDIIVKVPTTLKKAYTLLEIENILKKYHNNSSSIVTTFTVPPVRMDDLDDIKTVFSLESKFIYDFYAMNEKDVINTLKQKSREYIELKK